MSTREIWYRYLVISPAADEGKFHGLSGEGGDGFCDNSLFRKESEAQDDSPSPVTVKNLLTTNIW
jgi:hypothetical protein